jgi:hypothetical protein
MTEYIKNGGKLTYYSGTELPPVDWEKLGYFDYTRMFQQASGKFTYSNQTFYVSNGYIMFNTKNIDFTGTTLNIDCSRSVSVTQLLQDATLNNLNIITSATTKYNANMLSGTTIIGDMNEIDCASFFYEISGNNKANIFTIKGNFGGLRNYGKSRSRHKQTFIDVVDLTTRDNYIRFFTLLWDYSNDPNHSKYKDILQCGSFSVLKDEDIKIATDKGWIITELT